METINFTLDQLFPILTKIGKEHPVQIDFGKNNIVCTIFIGDKDDIITFNPDLKICIVNAIIQYHHYDPTFKL